MIRNIHLFYCLFLLFAVIAAPGILMADQVRFKDSTTATKFIGTSARTNWCDEVVALKVTATQNPTVFNPPDSAYLQTNLVGQARAIMGFSCRKLRKITISGWYQGKLYYAATASKNNGWTLEGIYAEP